MLEKIGFIGCGNMATAIINGIVNQGYIIPENIFVYDIDENKTNAIKANLNLKVSLDIPSLCLNSDVIFLCVKPQTIDEPLNALKDVLKNKVLVSICAGIKIEKINSYFETNKKIIRVMPNLCLMYNEGASAISAYNVDNDELDFVFNIFNSLGKAIKIDESLLDVVTGLSGSGPAFVFEFLNSQIEAATSLGLGYKEAKSLLVQTLRGSAKVLEESDKSVDELIAMVSSKGGTTVAGLTAMRENGFNNAAKSAVISATNRSKELSNL